MEFDEASYIIVQKYFKKGTTIDNQLSQCNNLRRKVEKQLRKLERKLGRGKTNSDIHRLERLSARVGEKILALHRLKYKNEKIIERIENC